MNEHVVRKPVARVERVEVEAKRVIVAVPPILTGKIDYEPGLPAERVELIQLLYGAGLSSKTISDLLPCVDAKVTTPESRARLAAERARIDAQINDLIRTRDKLDAVIELTESPEISGCVVVPA